MKGAGSVRNARRVLILGDTNTVASATQVTAWNGVTTSGEFTPPPTNVPENGTTAVLLGSALMIVALAGSRRTRAVAS